jgi:hypothetical protein
MEEKLIFKNNTDNVTDGDPKVILDWIEILQQQQAMT